MNSRLYYFSATGNSLVVAKHLAEGLSGVEIVPITKALRHQTEDFSDSVGIVFPVYMFGLPLIVAEFLYLLKIKPEAYVYTVATLGGLPGRAHTQAKNILKQRGIELSAGFSVRMPGNYIPLYGAITREKQAKMFRNEKERIADIVGFVRGRTTGIMEESPKLLNYLLFVLLYKGGSAQIPLSGKGFWSTEACTKCGLCARICPVANIELQEGRPKWLYHCQHCMACLQWCPVEAIQYKKSTLEKKRYHHPDVGEQDIIGQRE